MSKLTVNLSMLGEGGIQDSQVFTITSFSVLFFGTVNSGPKGTKILATLCSSKHFVKSGSANFATISFNF